jgi:Putative beta-barrel porin 2
LSNLRKRALILTIFVGFCDSSWGQDSQNPLPTPAFPVPPPSAPEAVTPPPAAEQTQKPAENEALAPANPVNDGPAITLSPVQGQESAGAAGDEVPKWRLHLGVNTSVTYDDNIFIQPVQRDADVYFGITPLLAAGWGTFRADPSTLTGTASRFPQIADREASGNAFYFRYGPTALLFMDHTDQNAFNEDVLVAGRWASGRTTLEGEGRFQTLSTPNIDVGNRINSQVTDGYVNMNYQMAQKTSLDSRFSLEHDSYQGGLNSTDTSISTLLNYQALPKTTVGFGFGVGYTTVESGQNQYYEQGLVHLHYTPTYKISVDLVGGAEDRQIENGPNRATPVFDLEASYAAQDSTKITLKIARSTDTSALFENQDIENTTFEVSIRQRFLQKFYIELSGGYQRDDYVDAGTAANRTDNFTYAGVESAVEVTKWLSMKAGYHFQNNDSSLAEFGFHRNLVDFQFNLQF